MPIDRFGIIIGAMKAGTTSLYSHLARHQEVCECKRKETNFFTLDGMNQSSLVGYYRLWDWCQGKHKVAVEASPNYTQKLENWSGTARRIAELGLDRVRLIYIVRHPIDRIESQIRHGMRAGFHRSLDHSWPDFAIATSKYAMWLDHYAQIFTRNRIHVLTLEEYGDDPYRSIGEVCKFLGISEQFALKDMELLQNSSEGAERNLLSWFLHDLGNVARDPLSFSPTIALRRIKGLARFDRKARFRFTEQERAAVLAELAPDLMNLRDNWGIDVEQRWGIEL